jgi:hypothetical protein
MDIGKLLKIKDKDRFEDVLGEELGADFEALPLGDGCEEGGYPDESSVDVCDVVKTGEDEENIYATFSVSFSEAFNTSCANCVVEKSRHMNCAIVIDKVTEEAEISVREQEREPEF